MSILIPDDVDYPHEWPWRTESGQRRLPTVEENPTWYTKDGRLRGSLKPVTKRCGKHLRGTNPPRYCLATPPKGLTVCRFHGGKTPTGIANSNYKHGRYSKYLPKNLKSIAEEVSQDPEILSLKDDLVVQTSWIAHKLNEFNKTPPPNYGAILLALGAVKKAKTPEERNASLSTLEEIVTQSRSVALYHASLEQGIRDLIQERTKTASAEWKRLQSLNALVPFDQVMLLLDSLLVVVREIVNDDDKLARIQEGMRRLMPIDESTVITLSQRNGQEIEE